MRSGHDRPECAVTFAGIRTIVDTDLIKEVGKQSTRRRFSKAITQMLDGIPEGLGQQARAHALQACTVDLDVAQREEELLIRRSSQLGDSIARRPDADPIYALSFLDPA